MFNKAPPYFYGLGSRPPKFNFSLRLCAYFHSSVAQSWEGASERLLQSKIRPLGGRISLRILIGRWKEKAKAAELYQRDAEAPHICPDVVVRLGGIWRIYSFRLQEDRSRKMPQWLVSLSLSSHLLSKVGSVQMFTHCHVGGAAGAAGLGLGVDEASADAKVAQFDLTFCVQQDVGGFDVSVDDSVFLLQIQQRLDDLQRRRPSLTFSLNLQVLNQHWIKFSLLLTATVIFPRMRSGMGPWILFFSFSAHVPISSMAMNTSVCVKHARSTSSDLKARCVIFGEF